MHDCLLRLVSWTQNKNLWAQKSAIAFYWKELWGGEEETMANYESVRRWFHYHPDIFQTSCRILNRWHVPVIHATDGSCMIDHVLCCIPRIEFWKQHLDHQPSIGCLVQNYVWKPFWTIQQWPVYLCSHQRLAKSHWTFDYKVSSMTAKSHWCRTILMSYASCSKNFDFVLSVTDAKLFCIEPSRVVFRGK